MAHVAAKALREKSDQELEDQIAMIRKRIFDETVRGASGEAIKPHEKREGRRLVARIQTVLNERRLRQAWTARAAQAEAKPGGAARAAEARRRLAVLQRADEGERK